LIRRRPERRMYFPESVVGQELFGGGYQVRHSREAGQGKALAEGVALSGGEGAHYHSTSFASVQRSYQVQGEEFGFWGNPLPAGQSQRFGFGHALFSRQAIPIRKKKHRSSEVP